MDDVQLGSSVETSPRQRLKKLDSIREEFPDGGPDFAAVRVSSLITQLISQTNDRGALERELEWLEMKHPLPVARSLCQGTFVEDVVFSKMSSLIFKNFVSRCGGWRTVNEVDRTALLIGLHDALCRGLGHRLCVARALAALLDSEQSAMKQEMINTLLAEASRGFQPSAIVLSLLQSATLYDSQSELLKSLCLGLMAASTSDRADKHFIRAIFEILEHIDLNYRHMPLTSEAGDLLLVASIHGVRMGNDVTLQARMLSSFVCIWRLTGKLEQLAHCTLEMFGQSHNPSILLGILEFWCEVSVTAQANLHLERLMSLLCDHMLHQLIESELEPSLRELLVKIVSRRPDCADLLSFSFQSCVDGEEMLDRFFSFTALGVLCHCEWLMPKDGPMYNRFLITGVLDHNDLRIQGAALWALENACTTKADVFFSLPGDFGRLVEALIELICSSQEEVAACACRSLEAILKHDKTSISGSLARPFIYHDELGPIPSQHEKTNRFSAFFSRLVEALLETPTTEYSTRAFTYLINTSANDVLGFVSWVNDRQIRALWARLGRVGVGGRKRPWGAPRNSQLEDRNSAVMVDARAMQATYATSDATNVNFICDRIKSCILRLSREERSDPALWKVAGDAANALIRMYDFDAGHRASIVSSLRTISLLRNDINLAAVIEAALSEEDDKELIVSTLGVYFTMSCDLSAFRVLEDFARSPRAEDVRRAAVIAMGDFIADRQRKCCDATQFLGKLGQSAWELMFWEDRTVLNPALDSDIVELIWETLDSISQAFLTALESFNSVSDVTFARFISTFIVRKASMACRGLRFHELQTSVMLRCLTLIVIGGSKFSRPIFENHFERHYEEFGPLFDASAQALKGASGEIARRVGKAASDALYLVYPKGTFDD